MSTPSGEVPERQIANVYRRIESVEARVWWGPVLRGLIAIVLGVIVFTLNNAQNDAVKLACIWIGVFALANGVIALLTVFLDKTGGPRTLPAAIGVISIVLGLLLVIWPVTMAKIAIVLMGLFLIAMGAMQIYSGAKVRQVDPKRTFNGLLILGIVLLALGVLTVMLPIFAAKVFIFIAALVLVLVGITFVAIGFSIRKALRAV